jgi:putative hydrolase of the HAD superfamily
MISDNLIIENEHFSFDLWQTIIKSNQNYKTERVNLFKTFFNLNQTYEELTLILRKVDINCNKLNEITGLHLTFDQLVYLFLLELKKDISCIQKSVIDELYIKNENIFLENLPNLILNINIFENIKSKGKDISLISNTGFIKGETIVKLFKGINILKYFDFFLFSDETGLSKPNPKIFELSYERIVKYKNIPKNRVIHIGDNKIADYDGAVSFGYNALLV